MAILSASPFFETSGASGVSQADFKFTHYCFGYSAQFFLDFFPPTSDADAHETAGLVCFAYASDSDSG
jgi:hypothetical protein